MVQPTPPAAETAEKIAPPVRDLPSQVLARFGANDLSWSEVCRWWVKQLHGDVPSCPSCSAAVTGDARLSRFREFAEIRCLSCHKRFSAKTGTILDHSRLDPREAYLLAFLLSLGLPTRRIADIVRCDPNTVRNWAARFEAHAAMQEVSAS